MNCHEFARISHNCDQEHLSPDAREHLSSCAVCAAQRDHASSAAAKAASGWRRRDVVKFSLSALLAAVGAPRLFGQTKTVSLSPNAPVEYIVVGSGAGGGPLACRLALAGHKVVLFEAGDNYPFVANVPTFAALVTEDPSIQWDYWVRHYSDTNQQRKDSKYVASKDPDNTGGILYPRAGTIGGCTTHSALISMYPSDSDWDSIAQLTGDSSWSSDRMRTYFERVENCTYVPRSADNPSRHGFFGWLPSSVADMSMFANDTMIVRFVRATLEEIYQNAGVVTEKFQNFVRGLLDPNDARLQKNRDGFYNLAMWAARGQRRSVREFILATAAALPNNLVIQKNSLVTRVLFDGTMATGVEYMSGARLYRADPNPAASAPARQQMTASREVIVSAGAFNSPQLLKLSGIGPAEELARHGIRTIVDLPGVGENLQDRYEVGIVTEQSTNFSYNKDCTYFADLNTDPCAAQWFRGSGPYTTNGVYGGFFYTSAAARRAGQRDPDFFIFGAAAQFRGYFPGYALQDVAGFQNRHTWVILKAYTVNRGGRVTLRSTDPRDTPVINFHHFDEGTPGGLNDLEAVADAVELVQRISTRVAGISNDKVWPGPEVRSRRDIEDFIRNETWGHHASCTNKMGPASDRMAVVDSNFRVHGTRNLRVVDASIFPRIPGYFILAPIYMASEKAADVILASAT
ncbi:MAG TPA: GMC family oxidoreductase [Vicinamibacterales bacterium]|nr:GMC family oxidoreductase [Vicinamibacterales bacterium]